MRDNNIYWRCNSIENAIKLLDALSDKYLTVSLMYRKGKAIETVAQFDKGMTYSDAIGIRKQKEFAANCTGSMTMYHFIDIKSVN